MSAAKLGPTSGVPFDPTPNETRRFWERVEKANGCWLWRGALHRNGYGAMSLTSFRKGPVHAHRIAYRVACGPIPAGMCVRHRCDNPSCVNPAHLELGTHRENMRDMLERGRHPGQKKSYCKRGHLLSVENLYVSAHGRSCVACRQILKHGYATRHLAQTLERIAQGFNGLVSAIPPTEKEMAALVGERRAFLLASMLGLYGHEMSSLVTLGAQVGLSRERVRQLVVGAIRTLNRPELNEAYQWSRRAKIALARHGRHRPPNVAA